MSDQSFIKSTNQIVSKVWSFCNTLRDVGVGRPELRFI
jgi:hypothetical protein